MTSMTHATWLVGCLATFLIACGGGDAEDTPTPSPTERSRGEVAPAVPGVPEADRRYIIYLHNLWLENSGPDVPHPEFGEYEFDEILRALAEPGLTVIGEVRPRGADPHAAARRVADQVSTLLQAGVPAEHVTVAGFSKGGAIAILASAEIADDRLNFVFLAACGPWVESTPHLIPRGRLLSIRESSDEAAGSCGGLFARAPPATQSREIVLSLGGGHGAFFRPRPEWIEPVIRWATEGSPS